MKTKSVAQFFTMIFVVIFSFNSYSQFEQKFTIQASGGLVKPLGDIGEEFSAGFSFDAGSQYNQSRSLAFVGLVKFLILYPIDEEDDQSELKSIGISICPKYRFIPSSKINPYVFGGVGLSFTKYCYIDTITTEWVDVPFPTSFSYIAGVGVDASIHENFALFFQTGYNSTILKDDELDINFNSLYFQVGINFSFLKSKSL